MLNVRRELASAFLLVGLICLGLLALVYGNLQGVLELERVVAALIDCPNRPGVSADIAGPPTRETVDICLGGQR